jgi:choline dehydrogenase-like flavoprotein
VDQVTVPYDLLVVGSGPVGAVVVEQFLRARPEARVLVVEAGGPLTQRPGEHLIETGRETLRNTYLRLMRSAQQLTGDGRAAPAPEPPWSTDQGGMLPAHSAGHDMREFPGAAIAWNVGGAGVHWTGACPWPAGPELVTGISASSWRGQLAMARRLLRVGQDAYAGNPFQSAIIDALKAALPGAGPGRRVQPMPMAGPLGPDRVLHRTGPLDILPELAGGRPGRVELSAHTLCTRILVRDGRDGRDGRVCGVVVRDPGERDPGEREIPARVVVIAADALRTPQLLWASGVRPEALGQYLNEHASITGEVAVEPTKLRRPGSRRPVAAPGEPFVGAYWCPSQGNRQPIHGQLMETAGESWHMLGLTFYAVTRIRPENRLEFSPSRVDRTGLPAVTARFRYGERDLETVALARAIQARAGRAIGDFDPATATQLPAGSSLHYTGTVRMGLADDGTSVCDTSGRVWGLGNLFLAGNGVIPTALSCNSTLTAAALAVRTAHAAALPPP